MNRHLDLDAIARAARDIDPVFRATPQYEADALGHRIGARVLLKVETVNPIRSFKGRGTDFYLRTAHPLPRRLVTASAGNFGQGLAYAARARGVALDVFAAESANPLKVARMRELGANVHLAGRDFDDAKAHAREHARREGTTFVEDGREPAIAEGAGSIAVELLSWPEPIAAAVIPLGNGALLGGMGAWIRHASPATRIIGVCAAGAPAMRDSLRLGRVVETKEAKTIADGIAVRVPIPEALDYLAPVVDDVVLVSEDAMRRAMELVLAETGLVSEPAGVAGIAALIEHPDLRAGGLTATPLCGSNASAA
ncbi:MAG TPA: pyridoxal-phosphate dependent enzyme [Gemmatimonadaceae bacterium]